MKILPATFSHRESGERMTNSPLRRRSGRP
jgi:hypothetical protein